MARNSRTYTQQQKSEVLAAILTGSSLLSVAEETGIPYSTIQRWSVTEPRKLGIVEHVEDEKEELGALVTEYIRESLRTLTVQARQFASPDWLQKQSANDVAILHGVMADKTIRVLSAIHSLD